MNPPPPDPAELRWLIDAIGREATLRLMNEFGGTRLMVPSNPDRPKEGAPLATLIGLDAARRLAEVRGGGPIHVPLCRWWRIALMRHEGKGTREIALALKITESAVKRHARVPSGPRGRAFPTQQSELLL